MSARPLHETAAESLATDATPLDRPGHAHGSPVLADHAVAIRGSRIEAVGPAAALASSIRRLRSHPLPDHLLIPGLINAHTHAAMILLRGAGDDLRSSAGSKTASGPWSASSSATTSSIDGTVLACREMLLGGVTCFSDMYFFPEATARAALAMGMRAVLGIIVFDFATRPTGSGPGDYLSKGLALRDETTGPVEPELHAFAACAVHHFRRHLRRVASLAAELQLPIATHLHETAGEIDDSLDQYGHAPDRATRESSGSSDPTSLRSMAST